MQLLTLNSGSGSPGPSQSRFCFVLAVVCLGLQLFDAVMRRKKAREASVAIARSLAFDLVACVVPPTTSKTRPSRACESLIRYLVGLCAREGPAEHYHVRNPVPLRP